MELIEVIGFLVGLIYLYLEYKANKLLWPVGVLMPIIYIWIFYKSGFYADMGINIYYFFASIYGWIIWTRKTTDDKPSAISSAPLKLYLPIIFIFLIIFAVIAYVLLNYTNSTVPYGDSFTTALSIVAMWMLAQKYTEQWVLWFVVNVVSSFLYFWKGLYITGTLFIIYSTISMLGYFKWKKMAAEQEKIKI